MIPARNDELFWSIVFTANLVVLINALVHVNYNSMMLSGFGLIFSLYLMTRR